MEVKPGYKQTEVGIIPEDWDASRVFQAGTSWLVRTVAPTIGEN